MCGGTYEVWSVNTEQEYHEAEQSPQRFTEREVPVRLYKGADASALASVPLPEES